MSAIRNIWSEISESRDHNNVPLAILQEQAKAINSDAEKTEITAAVITLTNSTEPIVKHVLYLVPRHGNNYNYRFVEFIQPVDSYYPVKIEAYQQGDTNFGECRNEDEIYSKLTAVFQDIRRTIVFDQLKNIGHTIRSWRAERETE